MLREIKVKRIAATKGGGYLVTLTPGHTYPVIDGRCRCLGFQFHGHCKHLKAVAERVAAEQERYERQLLNAKMFDWYYS